MHKEILLLKRRILRADIGFIIFAGLILYLFFGREYFLSLPKIKLFVFIGVFILWGMIFISKMRLSSYIFIALIASLFCYINDTQKLYLWLSIILFIFGFLSSLLDSSTSFYIFKKRNSNNNLGKMASIFDLIISICGTLAMIGQFLLLALFLYWWLFSV